MKRFAQRKPLVFQVDTEELIDLLQRHGYLDNLGFAELTIPTFPADARLMHVTADNVRQTLTFFMESDEIADGHRFPGHYRVWKPDLGPRLDAHEPCDAMSNEKNRV